MAEFDILGYTVANMSNFKFTQRWQIGLTTVFAAALLLIGNLAYWINNSFFDTNTFTQTATAALTSESSRQAMANEVVDRALANRPIVKNVAGDTAVKLVSGLLGTNQARALVGAAMSKMQVYLTSSHQESVEIDLSGVKNVIGRIVTISGNEDSNAAERLEQVPDKLVLLNANNVPDIYPYTLTILWLGPIAVIVALILLAYPYFRWPREYFRISFIQGLSIAGAAALSLLWGPLFQPLVLSPLQSANTRIVVNNLYEAFITRLVDQTYMIIGFALALAIIPWAIHLALDRWVKPKRDARASQASKPSRKSKPRAAAR